MTNIAVINKCHMTAWEKRFVNFFLSFSPVQKHQKNFQTQIIFLFSFISPSPSNHQYGRLLSHFRERKDL
jgi:hypothetical protein